MKAKILIVDDEPSICFGLEGLLSEEGYAVRSAFSGSEALRLIASEDFDAVLSDIKLGDIDGLQVLDEVKRNSPDTVTILLTGHGSLESSIQALRKGAHDYLLKPISAEQLKASIQKGLEKRKRALHQKEILLGLERQIRELRTEEHEKPTPAGQLYGRDLVIDPEGYRVIFKGREIELTTTEFELLHMLARGQGRVFSCREIVREVQGYNCDEREARELLRMHIYRLRQKLEEDPSNPSYLINVRGKGYTLRT
ncbi:MAG: response regulator transcription factor [Anaerolineae bacterium]